MLSVLVSVMCEGVLKLLLLFLSISFVMFVVWIVVLSVTYVLGLLIIGVLVLLFFL